MLKKRFIGLALSAALLLSAAACNTTPTTTQAPAGTDPVTEAPGDPTDAPTDAPAGTTEAPEVTGTEPEGTEPEATDPEAPSGELYFWEQTAEDIAGWETMATPSEDGGGQGTVEAGDGAAIVKAAADGWGGVQSEEITLDLSQEPMILIQIKENADPFKWGAKFVPSEPMIEDHAWGFYLAEDNNFKHNNYATADIAAKLGQDVIDLYGEEIKGHIWLMAAGGPEATVEVASVKMFNQADKADDFYVWSATADDIAAYEPMATPSEDGGGQGSVEAGDGAAIVKAAADGWGGVQSEEITIDLTKNPMLLIQIKENADPFKWGAKFLPSDPKIEDHAWGFYLAEDNNFKHNNYAGVDITEKLGQDIIDLYGEEITGHIWFMAAGGPEATVEVASARIFNQE